MRPTLLQFRSPREQTPDASYPMITYDGRSLSKTPPRRQATLPRSRRFPQYEENAKKTGFCVGPGRYNLDYLDIARKTVAGGPVYRNYHATNGPSKRGFFYAGNHLVCDTSLTTNQPTDEAFTSQNVTVQSTSRLPRSKVEERPRFTRVHTTDTLKIKERPITPEYKRGNAKPQDTLSSKKRVVSPYLSKVTLK